MDWLLTPSPETAESSLVFAMAMYALAFGVLVVPIPLYGIVKRRDERGPSWSGVAVVFWVFPIGTMVFHGIRDGVWILGWPLLTTMGMVALTFLLMWLESWRSGVAD